GWASNHRKPKEAVQRELFLDLSDEEKTIVDLLQETPEGIQINTLLVKANIPIHRMSPLLFELEMKGVVRALAGGIYQLI
ncbi:MAG: DNA-protecting protein DprA, partial [Muribaculaceae bacterium]|nr:DNA-protecting protein DprA [Muribaculaceae bacterium]